MILLLYSACLITGAMCHEENQNVEYRNNLNVTTLYPVEGFSHTNENNNTDIHEALRGRDDKIKSESEEQHKDQLEENSLSKESSKDLEKSFYDELNDVSNLNNKTDITENKKSELPKLNTTNWKIDTTFTPSKLGEEVNKNISLGNKTPKAAVKEFKPSPQLGHFYSEDAFVVPTQTATGFSPLNKNIPQFFSSPRDYYRLNYKPPTHSDPNNKPYKFEKPERPREKQWKHSTGIEAKPTTDAPVKVPAGGLYKLSDPFKEKPSSDGDDDNFGLDFKDEEKDSKENPVKKRGNPWRSLLHVATALLPVGIILAALTPNIITLETADNSHYPNRFSRLSGEMSLPPISEQCKRRLLCELHSDVNYSLQSSPRSKQCYKIVCHDRQALNKVLHWLLLYNRSRNQRAEQHDRRGIT